MLKIFILGSSGSGKTTLAEELAARLQLPHYDLDTFFRKHGNNMAGYAEDARAIAAESGWIAAGNFLIWTDPLLYQADVIVWLEIPWPIAIWRIISRHIIKSLRGINPYPGLRGIKLLLILLKGIRPYNVDKVNADSSVAEAVRQYLAEHEADTTLADTETLVTRWKTCLKDIPFTKDFSLMYLEKYKAKVFPVRNKADRTRLLESLTSR